MPPKKAAREVCRRSPPLEKKSKPIKKDWVKIAVKTNKSGRQKMKKSRKKELKKVRSNRLDYDENFFRKRIPKEFLKIRLEKSLLNN